MSKSVAFKIPGRPVAWARARTNNGRYFVHPKQMIYRNKVIQCAKLAANGLFFLGPVSVRYTLYFARAKSNKTKSVYMSQRPDQDNIQKLFNDSLNGVLWRDDAQIAKSICEKLWSTDGAEYSWVEVSNLE